MLGVKEVALKNKIQPSKFEYLTWLCLVIMNWAASYLASSKNSGKLCTVEGFHRQMAVGQRSYPCKEWIVSGQVTLLGDRSQEAVLSIT